MSAIQAVNVPHNTPQTRYFPKVHVSIFLAIGIIGALGKIFFSLKTYQKPEKPNLLFESIPFDEHQNLNFAEMVMEGKLQLVVVKHPTFDTTCEIDKRDPYEVLLKIAQDQPKHAFETDRHHGPAVKYLLNHPSNSLLDGPTFLNYVLEKEPSGTLRIFSLNAENLLEILEIAQEQNVLINLHEQDPISQETLFSKWAGKGEPELTKAMLALDSSIIQQNKGRERSFFAQAVEGGEQEEALILQEAMQNNSVAFSAEDLWILKAFTNDHSFTDDEFKALTPSIQKKIYRIANIYGAKKIVVRLNNLGLKEELLPCIRPEIISPSMDFIEVKKNLKFFLKNLRENNLLLTKEEFAQKIPVLVLNSSRTQWPSLVALAGLCKKFNFFSPQQESKFIYKAKDIGRILGRNYLEEKAIQLGLKHIKVPKKIAVIDVSNSSTISIGLSKHLEPFSYDLKVYAEHIQTVDRKLGREELLEFLNLMEATGYNDCVGQNFIVAADGVYVIDTEYTNFSDKPKYDGFLFHQLKNMAATEDEAWINTEWQERIAKYETEKESLDLKSRERKEIWKAKLHALGFDSRSLPFKFKIKNILQQ